MNTFTIRPMRQDEISLAVEWAAGEGWNPGLADDACFASVDPEGFFIAELDGAPAATISCVNYGATFAFLGLYIVRKDLRGCGYGLHIWNAALAHDKRDPDWMGKELNAHLDQGPVKMVLGIQVYTGRKGSGPDFPIGPQECFFVRMSAFVAYVPSHY